MSLPLRIKKNDRGAEASDTDERVRGERRSVSQRGSRKKERRRGRDRRSDDGRRTESSETHDLYQSDLDRHLWSWTTDKRGKKRRKRKRRRKAARLVASAAGMLGAAGLSYFLYRKLRKGDRRPDDVDSAQAESDDDYYDED